MPFVIHRSNFAGWGELFSDCKPKFEGQAEAVLLTRHGFVHGTSYPKSEIHAKCQTTLYFVRDGTVFRTHVEGKQYKPAGMKKLARDFADQCCEA